MSSYRNVVFAAVSPFLFALLAIAADGSMLKPQKGSPVTIHVFEDLECPSCAHAYPIIWDVAKSHHVPVVLHDFPLRMHPWAKPAAVWGRYFDVVDPKRPTLGNDFRRYIYANQPQIDANNLLQYVQKFADDNKVAVPFAPDSQGKLQQKIDADVALGTQAHLEHTPTIFVVTGGGAAPAYQEISDLDKLTQIVEDAQKKATPESTPAKKHVTKHVAKSKVS